MMAAMVPLDRALQSSYRLSTVPTLLCGTVWPQFAKKFVTGGFRPPKYPSREGCLKMFGHWTTRVSLPNDTLPNSTSFHPTVLARCPSVTDR